MSEELINKTEGGYRKLVNEDGDTVYRAPDGTYCKQQSYAASVQQESYDPVQDPENGKFTGVEREAEERDKGPVVDSEYRHLKSVGWASKDSGNNFEAKVWFYTSSEMSEEDAEAVLDEAMDSLFDELNTTAGAWHNYELNNVVGPETRMDDRPGVLRQLAGHAEFHVKTGTYNYTVFFEDEEIDIVSRYEIPMEVDDPTQGTRVVSIPEAGQSGPGRINPKDLKTSSLDKPDGDKWTDGD